MAGVYATRGPIRKHRTSGSGLAKLALIKTRTTRASALLKRVRIDASTNKPVNLFDLENVEATLETIIYLCEGSVDGDER
jgi:hypothetical protein